jgi:hypothetical protein
MDRKMSDYLAYLDKELIDAKTWKAISSEPQHQAEAQRIKQLRVNLKALPGISPAARNWSVIQDSLTGVKNDNYHKQQKIIASLMACFALILFIDFNTSNMAPEALGVGDEVSYSSEEYFDNGDYATNFGRLMTQEMIVNEITTLDHLMSFKFLNKNAIGNTEVEQHRASLAYALRLVILLSENDMQLIEL